MNHPYTAKYVIARLGHAWHDSAARTNLEGSTLRADLRKAKTSIMFRLVAHSRTQPEPGVAAVLSFVIPGLGQFYNGKFWRGIFWLVVTPGLWIGSGGTLGWICHVVSAYTAYDYARKH